MTEDSAFVFIYLVERLHCTLVQQLVDSPEQ
jgi:hypothetical protein